MNFAAAISTALGAMLDAAPAAVRPRIPRFSEILSLFGEAAGHRYQLALLELTEARDRVILLSVVAGVAAAIGLLAGLSLTLVYAALVWDSPHRTWWLVGLTALYFGAAGAAAWWVKRQLARWRPFAETKFQLDQDGECIGRLLRTYRQ